MDTSLCVPGLHAVVFCNQRVSKFAYALRMFAENQLRSLTSKMFPAVALRSILSDDQCKAADSITSALYTNVGT